MNHPMFDTLKVLVHRVGYEVPHWNELICTDPF